MKIRFLEPGNRPYKPTPLNYFVYDRYIRTPPLGLNTLATIVKELVDDTYVYSESISRIDMDDVGGRGHRVHRYFHLRRRPGLRAGRPPPGPRAGPGGWAVSTPP